MKKTRKALTIADNINITPLLDVLTVLLFFLIKSMSVTSISLNTPDDIKLPISYIEANAEEAVLISLSKNSLNVDQEEIMKLDDGKYKNSEIGADQRTLRPLFDILEKKYKQRLALYEGVEGVDLKNIPAPKLLIQADKEITFSSMKHMLHTVAKAGYTDYQFIVLPSS
jgi:biopolymer transport protein ExbD